MGTIYPELIMVNMQAKDAQDAIRQTGKLFYEHGFVKDTYVDAALAREVEFPTGLQLKDIAVAMPHTDSEHVLKPGVCVVSLAEPVVFAHMGEPEKKVKAEMLFMMSILNPDEQIETLQKVLGVFQTPEVVAEFKAATDEEMLYQVAMKHIG
jgi:Phosphotransferase system mannitol/fructose-specific IIA domain (Ntr-type)